MIKVIYLINGLGVGGAEMMLFRLLQRLDKSRFKPEVIALLNLKGPIKSELEKLGIEVNTLGIKSKMDIFSLYRLSRLIKNKKPEILHTQLFASDIVGRIIGKVLGVPVIITSIRNIYYGGSIRDFMIKVTERCADKTTIVSSISAQRLIKNNVIPENKLMVLRNGIDPDYFCSEVSLEKKLHIREKYDLPKDTFLLISVGSLTPQKGYSHLLDAIKNLSNNSFNFHLAIAGDGKLRDNLVSQVNEMGLSSNVSFLGRIDNVPELMAAADVLVLSSLWEGLPGVVLEAMASELPVVATAVGGTPEIVVDGVTGILVPAGDIEKLTKAICNIMKKTDQERKEMGKKGRKRIQEMFHVDKMVKAYEKLYCDCLHEKNIV